MNSSQSGDLTILYRHLSTSRRRQLLWLSILMPLAALAEMLMLAAIVPFLAALGQGVETKGLLASLLHWLDRFTPAGDLAAAALLFAAAALLVAALRLALSWTSLRFAADLGHELNMAIQRRMLSQPYLFHVSSHSSRLLASLEKVDHLVLGLALRGIQAVGAAIISAAVIAALLLIDIRSAAVAVALVLALYGLALLGVRRRFKGYSDFLATAHDRRIQLVQENVGGIRDIILERSQDAHLAIFGAIDARYMRAQAGTTFLATAPRFLIEGVGLGLVALACIFVAGRPGGLTAALPILGALALGAQRLLPLANQFYSAWVVIAMSRPMLKDINAMLSLPIPDPGEHRPLPFNRAIGLERVGFHYPDRSQPALHNVDLVIPHGSRIAIVGRTGSGKSTLADLLMGLIEPTEGQIRIDGKLLTGAALSDWRQSVAHVPQSIFLADASIARNIAIGSAGSDPAMERDERAARIAGLAEFVGSLPDGYATTVGERGVRLSGGQRQRLAIARAIYKQAPLLVLDEATSALDEATEAAVLSSLDELHGDGRTIITIAHRLSTVQRCDTIFVLEDGQLVQSGSFTELFGRLNRLQEQGEL